MTITKAMKNMMVGETPTSITKNFVGLLHRTKLMIEETVTELSPMMGNNRTTEASW